MTRAIRSVSVERGHDPRHFSLMPFGGAGGLHAIDIANDLSIKNILIPKSPGILCAEGLILSNLQESFVKTCRTAIDSNLRSVQEAISELKIKAKKWFSNEGKGKGNKSLLLFIDMRYVGQNYELSINLGNTLTKSNLPNKTVLKNLFFEAHKRSYGHFDPLAAIEIVNIRLRAISELDCRLSIISNNKKSPKPIKITQVWFDNKKAKSTKVFERSSLPSGFSLKGPAIILQEDATTLLPPNCSLKVDKKLNLVLRT